MKLKIALISLCFMLLFLGGCNNTPPKKTTKARHKEKKIDPHELDFLKDTLYFVWKKYKKFNYSKKEYYDVLPSYSPEEEGVIFNIYNGESYESFLFEDGSISDTLDIRQLRNYRISPIEKIDSIHQSWHEKNKEVILNKYSHWLGTPPIINENFAYVVYLIVISDNKKTFVIYPVIWRNFEYIE